MNDIDIQNLEFLLAINEKGLIAWMEQADLDDLLYAEELLQKYIMEDIDRMVNKSDLSEVKKYLEKFSGKKDA